MSIVPIDDLKRNWAGTVGLTRNGPLTVTRRGTPYIVVMTLADYEKLVSK